MQTDVYGLTKVNRSGSRADEPPASPVLLAQVGAQRLSQAPRRSAPADSLIAINTCRGGPP